ncbi:ribosome biogenesis GTP-binding protein YihA/YsxC [Desulforhabdus amnigena]|jgi:GTP-binding protein|uniref:Probable GTP-binding protein EngB n=1 Tax=Desulforhabdus amnigena TaxID=40218 RepID=A0A9W6FTV9_9BACT|nr:ribosome biogenesis GTP-binding protein YihA/YsxC [Desulforhabdus amnigena]NLJ29346.1 YihA family ribosome biogenesis GTP-binding protein [Deltaproteobacteria bacterium]GLI34386.1 putative GTP-binding protein EngB [Desulforhabdus amnigena]
MVRPFLIKSAEFIKSAVRFENYPPALYPEVAFAGRSNVGKSSLINCLVQRKKLVRTSRTPGQTQLINFFLINGAFYFVDLPGYGFAKVPLKVRAQWGPMIETYLTKRESLRGVVHILDIRHPPTPDDLNLWHWFRDNHIPAIPVVTKADKIKRGQWDAQMKQISLSLGIPTSEMVLFSANTQQGRSELLGKLLDWLIPPDESSPDE